MFFMRKTVNYTFTSLLLLIASITATAQNGQSDVRFTVKNFDCATNKVTIQVQVKAHDAAHTFLMGDANYRFDYDPRIIRNPAIVSQENFSNQAPSSDLNYVAQNLNGSSVGSTLGTVSLNTIYGGGGLGAKLVGANWMNVACIRFDVLDASQCFNLLWHTDTQFPVTGMNEVELLGGGDYNLYIVNAGGYFGNMNMCTTQVCSGIFALDDINLTNKNIPVSGNILTNDNSNGGAILATTTPLTSPTNGTITIAANGFYTYTPNAGFVGSDEMRYRVCNTAGLCDTAYLRIQVLDLPSATSNNAPIAQNDNGITTMGIVGTGNVLSNDFDPNGNTLTVNSTPITNPTNGTLVLNTNGTYTYTPNNGFFGQDTFRYQMCDNGTPSLCATAMVVLNVVIDNNGTSNNPPAANDDAFMTYINTAKTGDLRANDTDPNNHTLTYNTTPLSNPAHGTVMINANGTFTYTPTMGYLGSDQFKYIVCDNGTPSACDTAIAFVQVYPIPNLPPVVAETPQTVSEDVAQTLCVTITDPNVLDTHAVTLCGMAHGTATAAVNNVTHQVCVTYTPNLNFNGQDTVCVIVCDKGTPTLCDTARIPVTISPVNDRPIVTITTPPTMPEDATLTVCGTITDPDAGNTFTATPCGAAHGTATTTVTGTQVCLTYTPTLNYNGTDTLCLILCDNAGACYTVKRVITILPVNDSPVVSETPKTVNEDMPITICQTITDPDVGDTFTATACGAAHGALGTPSVSGGQVCITYTPALNYVGNDTVCVILCDQTGACDTARMPVSVSPVPDPPVFVLVPITVAEDSVIQVCTTISDPDAGSSFTATPCGASHGTVSTTLTGNQVCVTYTPATNFNGTDTLCVIVCDNTGLCDTVKTTVTVAPRNDAPFVIDINATAPNNQSTTICAAITDVDPMDNHTVTPCGSPLHGSVTATVNNVTHELCVSYSPNAGYIGADNACFIVCDNGSPSKCDTVQVIYNVTATNRQPVALTDMNNTVSGMAVSGNVLGNDSDPDFNSLTVATTPLRAPIGGTITLNANGNYTYMPTASFVGTDTVAYKVCDNGIPTMCDTTFIILEVRPVNVDGNQKPIANDDNTSTPANTPIIVSVKSNDFDPQGGVLGNPTLIGMPTGGTATVNANGTVTFTPAPSYIGMATVQYQICDNGMPVLCDTASINVNIYPDPNLPNLIPTAGADAVSTVKNTAVTGNVSTNDSDPNAGQILSFTRQTNPVNGTVVFLPNGIYTYTPTTNFVGLDSFRYRVCDNGLPSLCNTAVVYITVSNPILLGTNLAPNAMKDNASTTAGIPVAINVKANDTDPNGQPLSNPEIIGAPTGGTVTVNPDGTVTFTPTVGFTGTASFSYAVCDNSSPALCDTALVTVTVNAAPTPTGVNTAPVAIDDANTTYKNTSVSLTVASNDTDPNVGQTLTFSLISQTTHGSVTLNANGAYLYTPAVNYVGPDQFTYQVCDNGLPTKCDTAVVYLTIYEHACATLELKVLLEGPFNSATGKMKTLLNQRGLLPGQTPIGQFAVATPAGQPFRSAPWNYAGTETVATYAPTVVDWVLVSIRTDNVNASSTIYKAAALLHDDGRIEFINTCFNLPVNGTYYVVIEHRNHIGVMSPTVLNIVNRKISFDFTTFDSYIIINPPSFGQKQIGSKWAMYAGDGKKNTQTTNFDINFNDSQLWKLESGIFDQYRLGDFNMDADVNFNDQVLWKSNNGRYSGVPH